MGDLPAWLIALRQQQANNRPAWQANPEAQPGYRPPRPLPRQMRPLEQRLYDSNPGVVAQAGQQMRQQREMAALPQQAAGGYSGFADRNQVQEFGQGAAEMTGAPSWARGIQDVQHGRPGEAIPEFLMGALNTAGIATLPLGGGARLPTRPMAPARPPMAPQRPPVMAAPELPPQRPPVSERLDAGSGQARNVPLEGEVIPPNRVALPQTADERLAQALDDVRVTADDHLRSRGYVHDPNAPPLDPTKLDGDRAYVHRFTEGLEEFSRRARELRGEAPSPQLRGPAVPDGGSVQTGTRASDATAQGNTVDLGAGGGGIFNRLSLADQRAVSASNGYRVSLPETRVRLRDLPEVTADMAGNEVTVGQYARQLRNRDAPAIVVARDESGRWRILDGHTRTRAARRAGRQDIAVLDATDLIARSNRGEGLPTRAQPNAGPPRPRPPPRRPPQ